jgi:Protein of unknown function (DUF1236)
MRMKRTLLVATAATSLLAGAGLAVAQSGSENGRNPAGVNRPAATSGEHGTQSGPHAQSQGAPQGSMGNRAQSQSEPKGSMGNRAQEGNAPNRMGQSEPNRSGKTDRMDAQKPSAQTEKSESDRNRGTAQTERGRNDNRGAAEDRTNENRGTAERNRVEQNRGAAENRGKAEENRGAAENRGRTEENRGTAQREGNRGKSVSLSTEQRTKIRETVLHERSAPRLARTDLNVNVSVGERIPRDRIHIRPLPLPASIVEIEPEWRGYDYFLVGDEVVVVDPDTFEIVAVIPA